MENNNHGSVTKESSSIESSLKNNHGYELGAGITAESQKTFLDIIDRNHKNFHITRRVPFGDIKFSIHNHLVHHALTLYSLGASPDRLEKIYSEYSKTLNDKPPKIETITTENWTQHLGESRRWSDYLEFFDSAIKQEGALKTIEKYAINSSMFSRFMSGGFHPLIHVGCGLEYQLEYVVAEGISQAAVHPDMMRPLITEELLASKGTPGKKLVQILQDASSDERFKGVLKFEDDDKIDKLLQRALGPVKEYAHSWHVPETEEGVKNAMKELYEACVLAYAATSRRPDKDSVRLDFYLLHGVTSLPFISIMLHYLDLKSSVKLLRAFFAAVLAFFISRGCPKLYLDYFYSYIPKDLTQEPNPWLDVISHALTIGVDGEQKFIDSHAAKTVRSLLKGEELYGPGENNIFLKAAQLTAEEISKGYFSFGGLGWDEEWEPPKELLPKNVDKFFDKPEPEVS